MLYDGHHGNTPKGRVPHTDNNVWPRYPSSTDNRGNVFLPVCLCVCVCVSVTNVNHHLNTPQWQSGSKKCMKWSCGAERVLHELHETVSVRGMRRAGRRGKTNGSGSGNTQPARPNNNRLLSKRTHVHSSIQQCSSVSFSGSVKCQPQRSVWLNVS